MRNATCDPAAIRRAALDHSWRLWRQLLHQEHVGRETAARRKRVLAEVAYSVPYYTQICRDFTGRRSSGIPCMLTLGATALAHLHSREPDAWPLLQPIVSLVPGAFVGRELAGVEDLSLGVAGVNDLAARFVGRFLRATAPESPGGAACTPAEAEELIPAARALEVAASTRVRQLEQIAYGRSSQEAA